VPVDVSSPATFHLRVGDQAWEAGALAAARAAYARAADADPRSWHAAFQLAWIDLAFGDVPAARMSWLTSAAPHKGWRIALADRVATAATLAGGLAVWDIDALRRAALPGDATWWEVRALRAHAARQHGLARACFDAASDFTSIRDYEPPRTYHQAIRDGRDLLAALRDSGRCRVPLPDHC
jgi:hypothetical protein